MMEWMEETLHANFRFKLKVERVLYESRTGHHHLVLLENPSFGRALYLDACCRRPSGTSSSTMRC